MWTPNPWQEDLLWHFLRTGDYWCGPRTHPEIGNCVAVIFVGGHDGDLEKLYAIKEILLGTVINTRGHGPWDYQWSSGENTEDYLRWFQDKIDNYNIIVQPSRMRWIRECLELIDAQNNQHRKAHP